jgi:cell division protein FtsB
LKERLRLLLMTVIAAGAVWFAVQGSEFGTSDIIRQYRQRGRLDAEIDSLTRVVDSLRRLKTRVLNDARTQERIAREEFGMVRGKELLYRFAEPDSQ